MYCELTDKELKDSYVEYTLLYDTIANRISIEDVQAKDGRLRLMENVWWEYDKLPHMLIAGGTGGGKTYFILTLIEALLRTNAVLFVLDPKNADLADLQAIMPDVYYKKEDMLACIDRFYEEMMKRSEDMKLMENYRTGENYAYLGLPANFLIFDEYVAFGNARHKGKCRCPQQVKTNRYAWAAGWLLPDSRLPASGRKVSGGRNP